MTVRDVLHFCHALTPQVLDEADRLLATESLHGIMKIHEKLPFQGVGDMRLQASKVFVAFVI